jgi:crotonobetainyl-CoA:carnitine CoA-transferase CaiB-like acyl-CoA transferase
MGAMETPDTRAPRLGEHTDQVLSEMLGFDDARLAELRAAQVI